MSWHDQTPGSRKRKKQAVTVTERLSEVERQCRNGDTGLHEALIAAYQIGIEAGRANPAVQRIGEGHSPELQT